MEGNEFFLARQPIVGRRRELFAYELLFRSSDVNSANIFDDVAASSAVIQYAFADLGIKSALGKKKGFINLSQALLMSDLVEILPPGQIVLELLESISFTSDVVERCKHLKSLGYILALDDVVKLVESQKLVMPYIDIVKVDIMGLCPEKIREVVESLRPYNIRLLAEKVETEEQYRLCLELGFNLFQGYFYAKPVIIKGRMVKSSTLVLFKLLSLTTNDADFDELEKVLKQAPELIMRFFKVANSAAFRRITKVSTIRGAIATLGLSQISRLIQIMIFTQNANGNVVTDPLAQTAMVRGRLMEEMAGALGRPILKDRAFLVGILSLFDALFGRPLGEIVGELALPESVTRAVLEHEGELGMLLRLVEASESGDMESVDVAMSAFDFLDFDQFNRMEVNALSWAASL